MKRGHCSTNQKLQCGIFQMHTGCWMRGHYSSFVHRRHVCIIIIPRSLCDQRLQTHVVYYYSWMTRPMYPSLQDMLNDYVIYCDVRPKNLDCVCFCVFLRKQTTERRGRKPTVSILMPCDGRPLHRGRTSSAVLLCHPSDYFLLHTHIFTQTHFKGQ